MNDKLTLTKLIFATIDNYVPVKGKVFVLDATH